jgi:hypothetical protein
MLATILSRRFRRGLIGPHVQAGGCLRAGMNAYFLSPPADGVRGAPLGPQAAVCIALILLLHSLLFWLAARPVQLSPAVDKRVWVQLFRPERHKRTPSERVAPSPERRARPTSPMPAKPSPAIAGLPKTTPLQPMTITGLAAQSASSSVQESPEEQALITGALPTKPTASAVAREVLQRALKDVDAIDRELRPVRRQEYVTPPSSPNARLVRGIEAAHAAVKPKWFEAARSELISAPNDPKKIYRVTTSAGEYCVYYPDKNSMVGNASGAADFGHPKTGNCPISF